MSEHEGSPSPYSPGPPPANAASAMAAPNRMRALAGQDPTMLLGRVTRLGASADEANTSIQRALRLMEELPAGNGEIRAKVSRLSDVLRAARERVGRLDASVQTAGRAVTDLNAPTPVAPVTSSATREPARPTPVPTPPQPMRR